MLLLAVFSIKEHDESQIFGRENQSVSERVLLFDQFMHIVLSNLHLGRHFVLRYVEDWLILVEWKRLKICYRVAHLHVGNHRLAIDLHIDAKVIDIVAAKELDFSNFISLWSVVEVIDAVGDDLSSQINHILFLERLFILVQLIDRKVKFALVDGAERALIVHTDERADSILLLVVIHVTWNHHDHS